MDPELEAFVPFLPDLDMDDPVASRKDFAERAAGAPAPDTSNMEVEDRTVPADPDVAVRIYRPHRAQGALVWLHGGGGVFGGLDSEHPWAARLADLSGAVVISVDYRLAPEHRFPAALDDAYAVLTWTAEHAAELGVDPERIAVGGHSAGGGSRPRWRCGRVTIRGRRSASSCSTSPDSTTGNRRGRAGSSPTCPG